MKDFANRFFTQILLWHLYSPILGMVWVDGRTPSQFLDFDFELVPSFIVIYVRIMTFQLFFHVYFIYSCLSPSLQVSTENVRVTKGVLLGHTTNCCGSQVKVAQENFACRNAIRCCLLQTLPRCSIVTPHNIRYETDSTQYVDFGMFQDILVPQKW